MVPTCNKILIVLSLNVYRYIIFPVCNSILVCTNEIIAVYYYLYYINYFIFFFVYVFCIFAFTLHFVTGLWTLFTFARYWELNWTGLNWIQLFPMLLLLHCLVASVIQIYTIAAMFCSLCIPFFPPLFCRSYTFPILILLSVVHNVHVMSWL
jgi:hypothetical protein